MLVFFQSSGLENDSVELKSLNLSQGLSQFIGGQTYSQDIYVMKALKAFKSISNALQDVHHFKRY